MSEANPVNAAWRSVNKFTFVFSEKEISIIECALEDHLDRAFGYPGQEQPPYSQYDVAELSAKITERLAW